MKSFANNKLYTILISIVFVVTSFGMPQTARAENENYEGLLTDTFGVLAMCYAEVYAGEGIKKVTDWIQGEAEDYVKEKLDDLAGKGIDAAKDKATELIGDKVKEVVGDKIVGVVSGNVPVNDATTQSEIKAAATKISDTVKTTTKNQTQAQVVDKTVSDCIVYGVGQKVLNQLTQNMLAWINGGFQGDPSFTLNTHEIFLDLADMVAGDLARELRGIATCDFRVNYKNDLANAVELSTKRQYKFNSSVECPFPETFQLNSSDFYNGINKWSWEGIEYAMQESGNPWGVAFLTAKELELRSSEKKEVRKQELSWSSGFTNMVDTNNCNYKSTTLGRYDDNEDGNITQDEWNQLVSDEMITNTEVREIQKISCKTTTPGKIVADQLNKVISVDFERLGAVDSLNKIIGSVIDQVTKKATMGIFCAVSGESNEPGCGNNPLPTDYVTVQEKTAEIIAMENASIKPYYDAWQAEIKRKEDAEKELAKVWSDLNLWNSGNSTITDPASLNQRRTELESIIALAPERIATAKAAYDQVSSTEMAILRQQELVAAQQEVDYAKEGVRDAEYDYVLAQTEYYKALATEMDVILIESLKQDMLEMEAIFTRQRALLRAANDRLYAAKHPAYSTSPVPLQI